MKRESDCSDKADSYQIRVPVLIKEKHRRRGYETLTGLGVTDPGVVSLATLA